MNATMPRTMLWRAAGVLAAALATLALTRASATPVRTPGADEPRLRLSWSARPQRIEVCRRLSDAELAEREAHMRQRVECEGRFAMYALRVSVDTSVLGATLRGGGLRHDRPIHLLRELPVPSGTHRLRVVLTRVENVPEASDTSFSGLVTAPVDTGLFAGRAQREASEHERRARLAIPPRLALDTVVTFSRGTVTLVTLDEDRRLTIARVP